MSQATSFLVVIPTYKRVDELCACLSCLDCYFSDDSDLPSDIRLKVVVSDDAHDSQLCELLALRFPWCTYLQGPARGPAANRNHGARSFPADWIIFTDDDCLPQPGWITAFALNAVKASVLEGQTVPAGHRTRIDEECPVNTVGGLLWSCNFAIRSELFARLGGFNESFPAAAMEDVELRERILDLGYTIAFIRSASVAHPWRLRKGHRFIRAKAQSIATFVMLRPQAAASFSLAAELSKLLRVTKASVGSALAMGSSHGLLRQVLLDVYAAYHNWRAVTRLSLGSIQRQSDP